MKKTFHVVPHSHWDREWYFNTSRSKVYLMKDLHDVINTLVADNRFAHFVLDGQGSLLDDYLKWRPQDKEQVTTLIRSGKLIVGPWYTQTDQLVISGESIVRNLAHGIEVCAQFGQYMKVGYVPDSFGQGGNMPQIYQEFGIQDVLFWRGVSDDEVAHTEFIWAGEDGTEVFAYQIPSGYYIGGNLPENKAELAKFLVNEPFKTVISRTATAQVYFPNGFDQAPIRTNLPEIVDQLAALYPESTFKISSPEGYIEAVKKENPTLEKLSGELVNGKLMRIHKSIFSSRSDLKAMNTNIQNYLVNTVEPLMTLAYEIGFDYPKEALNEVWKLLFENAAHDSIGSCVSDNTNEDVYMRYKQARDISTNLVELMLREISTRIKNPQGYDITYTVFNPSDQNRSDVVEATVYIPQEEFAIVDLNGNLIPYTILTMTDQTAYVKGQTIQLDPSKKIYQPEKVYRATIAFAASAIPSVGYVQFGVDLHQSSLSAHNQVAVDYLENEFYKITVNKFGSLDILDKTNQKLYLNQASFEENGDDGDSFNYSPPRADLTLGNLEAAHTVDIKKSSVLEIATIDYQLLIPKNLTERAAGKRTQNLKMTLTVKLKPHSRVIDYALTVANVGLSHRVCLLFDTAIQSNVSLADQPFGLIKRPVVCTRELALYEANQAQWNEKPISIETCQSFVALSDEFHGVAVMPKGVREYEIVGENYSIIRVTIFRTYSHMGKENLLYRPGRASGETIIATPAAQLLKTMTFELATYYFQESFDASKVAQVAKASNTPLELYQTADFLNGRLIFAEAAVTKKLAPQNSLLHQTGSAVLSAIKKAEKRPGIILRYFNGGADEIAELTLTFGKPILKAELVDLKEEWKAAVTVKGDTIIIPEIGHSKLITLYVEYEQ